jgi:hypothetical protein
VTQLYPRARGSLSVASYDLQGYGGGVLTTPTGFINLNYRVLHPVARNINCK